MSIKVLARKAEELLAACRKKKLMIATAESCTGGLISQLLTDIPGSSDVFERGFITYSNDSKMEMLGVKAQLIAAHGAVSKEVAEAMARGAIRKSKADLAVAVTGIAGPGGGSRKKPVGTVYIAVAARGYTETVVLENHFEGDRAAVRAKSAGKALATLKKVQAFF